MISVMVLYCEKILKPKSVSWALGGGALLWELLGQAQFVHIICVVKKNLYPPFFGQSWSTYYPYWSL